MKPISPIETSYIPATGWRFLMPWYDPLVKFFTKEDISKEQLLDLACQDLGNHVLDVGCGSGTLLCSLMKRLNSRKLEQDSRIVRLAGVDIDPAMVSRAQAKCAASFSSLEQDAGSELLPTIEVAGISDLPHASGAVDLILCTLVFHHLKPKEKHAAAKEIKRLLSPDGKVFVLDFGKPSSTWRWLLFLVVRCFDGWSRTRDNVRGNLPQIFLSAGFPTVQERFTLATWLGTLYCWELQSEHE